MDGRDAFLTMARDKHYEFSSLRRSKYSTAGMLHELHNQARDSFAYVCNACKASVETRYHCTTCDVSRRFSAYECQILLVLYGMESGYVCMLSITARCHSLIASAAKCELCR